MRVAPLHVAVLLERIRGAALIFLVHLVTDAVAECTAKRAADDQAGRTAERVAGSTAEAGAYSGASTRLRRAARGG